MDDTNGSAKGLFDVCCENCGHNGLEAFIQTPTQRLLHCPSCLLYQKGLPPESDAYEEDYHVDYEERRRSKTTTALIRLGALTKYLDQPKPGLLDVGCSVGATVTAANRLGWEATGVDISQAAVDFCCSAGLNCQKIDGTELPFENESFDVLTSWHVIEHVTDVHETLAEWFRVLKPGGLMVLETPDSQCLKAKRLGPSYKKFWPAEHLYTFTRSNMCSLLESNGFEVLPSRIVGRLDSLPQHLTAYSAVYRSLRKVYRRFGLCKSIEVCCRKAA